MVLPFVGAEEHGGGRSTSGYYSTARVVAQMRFNCELREDK